MSQPRNDLVGALHGKTISLNPSLIDRTDRLNAALDHLEEMLATLRSRLDPVVTSSVPTDIGNPPAEASGSWLGEYLSDVTGRVHTIAGSIAAFTARVDL